LLVFSKNLTAKVVATAIEAKETYAITSIRSMQKIVTRIKAAPAVKADSNLDFFQDLIILSFMINPFSFYFLPFVGGKVPIQSTISYKYHILTTWSRIIKQIKN